MRNYEEQTDYEKSLFDLAYEEERRIETARKEADEMTRAMLFRMIDTRQMPTRKEYQELQSQYLRCVRYALYDYIEPLNKLNAQLK
jgi:hypothetical protein